PDARIAVLVRAKSRLAASVRELRRANLHFQAVEVENLVDQPVVQDLLALTRALSHAGDRTAWLAVLRAPWCGLSLDALHALAGPEDGLIPERLRMGAELAGSNPRYAQSRAVLLEALTERNRGSLREQVERVWLQLGGPAALSGAEALADAEAYFELLEELDQGGALASVTELTQHLARLFARPDPEADGSLQLMTVHKAKGLEFDVVIMPGLDAIPRGRQPELLLWLERPRADGQVDLLLSPLNATGSEQDPVYAWIKHLQGQQERLEAGRLLYVAATRAREQLHLIGSVRIAERDGEMQPSAPRSASLLALLWPLVEKDFAQALQTYKPHAAADGGAGSRQFTRLKAGWSMPAPAAVVAWSESAVLAGMETVPEFEWVGETLRHVGTVVHRLLQRMAADGGKGWDGAHVQAAAPFLRQLLAEAGVREPELDRALADVTEAALNLLDDPRGRWLLSDTHTEARSEYALSVIRDGRLETGIMDRTFVDEEGVRWIVDYKTSRHSGADLDAFLEQERLRYAKQLERYAELMGGLETRRVKVALYFPLLKRFVEWEPQHG
ncbi:MAG: 3'-5' exonuclease, partial [Gammaproteobacteria bacterium]